MDPTEPVKRDQGLPNGPRPAATLVKLVKMVKMVKRAERVKLVKLIL